MRRAVVALAVVTALAAATAAAGHPLDLADTDHDGWKDPADNCALNYNPKQVDTDGDTPPPVIDAEGTPTTGPVRVYPYTEGQGVPTDRPAHVGGDACDSDDDADGVTDNPRRDNCKLVPNPGQEDNEQDGIGDACDADDDNDAVPDAEDNCPLASNARQTDVDVDGTGDACDPDGPNGRAADPNDKAPPALKLRVARRYRFEALGRGLPVGVRCSEACVVEAEVRHGRRLVGRGAAQLEDAGFTFAFVDFSRRSLRRLESRPARTLLRVVAEDLNGNASTARRAIRLTRRPA